MTNFLSFIKKRWYLFVVLVLIGFLVFYFLAQKRTKTTPEPSPTPLLTEYKNIQPGKTTENDLKSQLGQPLSTTQQGSLLIYKYPSLFTNYPSSIFISNDKVVYINEPVRFEEKRNISTYLDDFGQPDTKLYNPNLGPAVPGYIYPQKGVAVFAHTSDGIIIEVWYFEAMSLDNFKKTWGKDLVSQFNNSPE